MGTNHVDLPERQIPKEEDPRELDRHVEPLEHQTRPRRRLGGARKYEPKVTRDPPLAELTKTKDREASMCRPPKKRERGMRP